MRELQPLPHVAETAAPHSSLIIELFRDYAEIIAIVASDTCWNVVIVLAFAE